MAENNNGDHEEVIEEQLPAPQQQPPQVQDVYNVKVFDDDGQAHSMYVPTPQLGVPCTFPSVWFEGNRPHKPKILIRRPRDMPLSDLRSLAYSFVIGRGNDPEVVPAYLNALAKTVSEGVTDRWSSYGRNIGGDLVFISDLYEVNEVNHDAPNVPDILQTTDLDNACIATLIAGMYRASKCLQAVQGNLLQKVKLLAMTLPHSIQDADVILNISVANRIGASDAAGRILNMYDMFLNRFSESSYRAMRIGTIITRHAGCSGLSDLLYFAKMMGKSEVVDILPWILTTSVRDDVISMFQVREEIKSEYSYFPYSLGLKLMQKSPFSASENISVHTFVHMIGCLFNKQRSKHSKLFDVDTPTPIATNAAIVYLASKRDQNLNIYYTHGMDEDEARRYREAQREPQPAGGQAAQPRAINPSGPYEHFNKYRELGYVFNNAEYRALRAAIQGINRDLRPGTVGEFMVSTFLTLLRFSDDVDVQPIRGGNNNVVIQGAVQPLDE